MMEYLQIKTRLVKNRFVQYNENKNQLFSLHCLLLSNIPKILSSSDKEMYTQYDPVCYEQTSPKWIAQNDIIAPLAQNPYAA